MAAAAPERGAARRCPWPAVCDGRPHPLRSNGTDAPPDRKLPLVVEFPGLQTTGGTEHDDRLILLVFGRLAHLLLGQFQRDTVPLVFNGTKVERTPIDDDLAAADAEETTEIDHCG